MVRWNELSRVPNKPKFYEREIYFREGLQDAERGWEASFSSVVRTSALLLLKPDGIAAGKTSEVLDFLARNQFAVVGHTPVIFSRLMWREMWRYQLTAATMDRLAVNELVLAGCGLQLFLFDMSDSVLPATVRLSSLKGSADLAKQQSGTLRAILRQANRIFSYIHVADEPADLIREPAILLEQQQRQRMIAILRDRIPIDSRSLLDEASTISGGHVRSFDASEAYTAFHEAMSRAESASAIGAEKAQQARATVERISEGDKVGLAAALAATSGLDLDPWDVAIIGANAIVADDPSHPKSIEGPDLRLWRDGATLPSQE